MTTDDKFGVEDSESDLPQVERTTIPPSANDPKEEKLSESEMKAIVETVGEKLSAIDLKLINVQGELQEVKEDVEELHALLLGIPHPNVSALKFDHETKRVGGIGQVFHDWNQYLTVIAGNTTAMLEHHEKYSDEVSRVHQENVKIKLDIQRLNAILALRLTEMPLQSLPKEGE